MSASNARASLLALCACVGATLGWRARFALVAFASLVAAGAVWLVIPRGLHVQAVDLAMWRAILRNRSLLTVLAVTGLFMAASHLARPFTPGSAALSPSQASVSIALNTSFVFLGQAAGTAGAGFLVANVPGSAGYAAIPWLTVPLLALAIGLSLLASLKMRAHPRSTHVQGRPA